MIGGRTLRGDGMRGAYSSTGSGLALAFALVAAGCGHEAGGPGDTSDLRGSVAPDLTRPVGPTDGAGGTVDDLPAPIDAAPPDLAGWDDGQPDLAIPIDVDLAPP